MICLQYVRKRNIVQYSETYHGGEDETRDILTLDKTADQSDDVRKK
jgi:hypothetical protein